MVEQMVDNPAPADQPLPVGDSAGRQKRIYSDIEFPYTDLEAALDLASEINQHTGDSCADKELAAWLNMSAEGGTYKARRSAARMFGLVDTAGSTVTLTARGREALDKVAGRGALAEAFLGPALYKHMYELLGGHPLPPNPAVERQMEQAGVSPKQKERARQVFNKSAVFAGFIDPTTGRFVKPGNGGMRQDKFQDRVPADNKSNGGGGGGTGSGDGLDLDPLLIELLRKIPRKEEGWAASKRVRWFRTFAMNVSQIFDGDDEPIELKIDVQRSENGGAD